MFWWQLCLPREELLTGTDGLSGNGEREVTSKECAGVLALYWLVVLHGLENVL